MLDTWNERSSLTLTIEFFDEEGLPVIPDAAWYTVEDVLSGQRVIDHTHITALAAVKNVVIPSAQNVLRNPALPFETRRFTVEYEWDNAPDIKHGVSVYEYRLKRQPGTSVG